MRVCCNIVTLCNNNEQLAAKVYAQAYLCPVGLPSSFHWDDPFAKMMSIIERAASVVAMLWYTAAKVTLWYKDCTKLYPYHIKFCTSSFFSHHQK